jgi:hypothetical protein
MNTQLFEQIYYVTQIISVVAVVISLIYVGKQVKQNTQAVKNSTLQNISENQLNIHGLLAAHGDLADIVFKAATGQGSDRGTEKFRFTAWMHTAMRSLENAFYQHREGALDDRNWRSLCRQYGPILHSHLNAQYWQERSFIYSEEFRDFVQNELLKTQLPEGWKVPGS